MRKFLPGIILISGISLIVAYLCAEVVIRPNTTLLSTQGDALKNYYTPEYHVKYDSSYTWFSGMNYPFGEQIVFTDAQPAISNLIKWISKNGVDLSGYVTGILNILILISIFGGGFFLYRILIHFGTHKIWAAISSVAIICLSPQLYRLGGHYALAYLIFIPGLWYLNILATEKNKYRISFLVLAWVVIWAFVHPYLLMVSTIFLGAWWAFAFLLRSNGILRMQTIGHFTLQVIIPFFIFSCVMFLTDPVSDRPTNPYGYFEYRAWWTTVFYPLYLPHGELFTPYMITYRFSWEGYAYIGLAAELFLFFSLFTIVWRFVRAFRGKPVSTPIPALIWLAFASATATLLFSMRYPFIGPLRDAVYLIPGLSQFRSIGRFSWIFYYVWTTIASWGAWQVFQHLFSSGKRFIAIPLAALFFGLFFIEGALWLKYIRPHPQAKPGTIGNPLPGWATYADPEKYSAMMVLPFFYIGSENYAINNSGSADEAMSVSLSTGIPLVNSMMSRTSFQQGLQQFQLVSEEFSPLSVVTLYGEKPLLIVSLKNIIHDRPYFLPSKGNLIFENETAALYEVRREELLKVGNTRKQEEVNNFETIRDTLVPGEGGFLFNQPDPLFYYQSYDDSMPGFQYAGKGGIEKRGWDYNYLFRGKLSITEPEKIRVSVWILGIENQRPLSELWVETINEDSVAQHFWIAPAGTDGVLVDRGWILMDHEFSVNPGEEIRIMIRKDSRFPKKVTFDEFMLRKSDTEVWKIQDGWLMHNNRWYPYPSQRN